MLTIIPARSGSKGIPGKNRKLLDGQPLIEYTLDTATQAELPGVVVVSTDDEAILQLAASKGVRPIRRPSDLASDESPVSKTIGHALRVVEETMLFDAIMLLQPTAPLREVFHLKEALAKLEDPQVQSVISVSKIEDVHPARMYQLEGRGFLKPYLPELEIAHRQDIPPAYLRNGSIYVVRRTAFDSQKSVMAKPSVPYVMSSVYLANIDEPRDWIIAEALVKAWKSGELCRKADFSE